MSNSISWLVELAIRPGELENFRALTAEMVEVTQSESGVLIYERYISPDGKTAYVYERYENPRAAVAHLRAFGEQFGERFSSMVQRRQLLVLGEPTAELRGIMDQMGATYAPFLDGFTR